MSSSLPDRRAILLLAACLLCLQTALAAKAEPRLDKETPLDITGETVKSDLNAGTLRMGNVTITQGPALTIRAALANGRGLKEGYDNSSWDFSGSVHIEFDGAVIDADNASVAFSNQRIITIRVQGKPARFSHQQKDSAKREGRANTIDYDARSGNLRLAGATWLFDGRNEIQSSVLLYNLISGSVSNDARTSDSGPTHIIIRPGKAPVVTPTIPTPRTPERSTAQ
jgi:lipopolysaccharide transport protein LptA